MALCRKKENKKKQTRHNQPTRPKLWYHSDLSVGSDDEDILRVSSERIKHFPSIRLWHQYYRLVSHTYFQYVSVIKRGVLPRM